MKSNKSESIQNSPDVKAYAHQVVDEFALFMTEETQIVVEERNPSKVVKKLKNSGELHDDFEVPKFCYSISMTESGAKLIEYGFGSNPYMALKQAKEKMSKKLNEIHDQVVNNSDRLNEINAYIQGSNTIH